MASCIQQAVLTGFSTAIPTLAFGTAADYQRIYDSNQSRIYALAFWLTDNELQAEAVTERVFLTAFSQTDTPDEEMLDRELIAEVRQSAPVGLLTLQCAASAKVEGVRHNIKRTDLERAVVQVPATERLIYLMHDGEGYSHARIARTVGIAEEESLRGLHQARLRLRELLAR